jgi:two-component system copper resistance phosphate regulon response regulator CusR
MKILIIEDDPDISSAVREGLDEAGYYTVVCRDGERGLRLASQGQFSLILLDLMLPSMDGITICKKLREQRVNTPILMLTARDAIPERVTGLEAGADDYLCKPFDFEELLARVRAMLRREKTVKAGVVQVDDLIVDTAGRTVSRGGKEIPLTSREYTLLEALATHEGQVLTRDAILERVWLEEDSVSNLVDVYIRSLRKKIDQDHERKLIHTVYGMGYVMRVDTSTAVVG